MPVQETMSQEQVRALLGMERQPATSLKDIERPKREGRYGRRHVKGVMNKTESSYALFLEARRIAGEVKSWEFEKTSLPLAKRCRYTPDFKVVYFDGLVEYVDVKGAGPINEASIVRLKFAKSRYPECRFVVEQKLPRKGGWKRTEY